MNGGLDMRRKSFIMKVVVGAVAALVAFSIDVDIRGFDGARLDVTLAVQSAEARIGRPTTPLSVAGVARRTTRRTVRRMHYYNALPAGCIWRAPYHYCGGIYYEPVVQNGQNVYIIVNP
jgi:hypothetical protein